MRRFMTLLLTLAVCGPVQAAGILIPTEKEVPPLAMLSHHVTVTIEDQVAITKVEQVFRNHTSNQLEATYIFPVPKEAGVTKFSVWLNGKEVKGEILEAKQARDLYLSMVKQTQDPGLLEYMGHNLLKMRVFPIPAHGEQKVVFSYTSVAPKDNHLIHYTYPLKTDGKSIETLEKFSVKVALQSQHALGNIYSPSHPVTITRPGDKQANIVFEKDAGLLDRNFQLYYTAGGKDVDLTTLAHRPEAGQKGHFMLLISPRAELSREQEIPRDIVFVLDTSGSMRGKRIEQARNALNYCLSNLNKQDRFAIIHFATGVHKYAEKWLDATPAHVNPARKWVDNLEATGGTAINEALLTALALRGDDATRTFNVVFFTDGRPTIGETNTDKIIKNVMAKNTANTRMFTFGVGDDVNATMLDQLAEQSRAVSTYVREHEDIETHVSSLFNKISHPVLTDLRLSVGDNIKLSEIYPPHLPDLFRGGELVVLGRYEGEGHAAVKLSGRVGKQEKEFVYEINFPKETPEAKPFVEDLWARRKVGYLLDQIRLNGEQKELVDEVTILAKKYGITTPYTSYLIVPDKVIAAARAEKGPGQKKPDVSFNLIPGAAASKGDAKGMPAAPMILQPGAGGYNIGGGFQGIQGGSGFGGGGFQGGVKPGTDPKATAPGIPSGPIPVADFAKQIQKETGAAAEFRQKLAEEIFNAPLPTNAPGSDDSKTSKALREAQEQFQSFDRAKGELKKGNKDGVQSGNLGVNLSVASNVLRQQNQVGQNAVARAGNTNLLDVGGVWIDENFDAKRETVTIKAMSDAYFRLLEKQPQVKDVLTLGNHLVWVTPSGTALVIDTSTGQEKMTDAEIDALFVPKK